jgi:Winged helix DNA-binding domain
MNNSSRLVRQRWIAQGLAQPLAKTPEAVIRRMGAVQAQEYGPAKWAIGLRSRSTHLAVERAIDQGRILRTHLLRPTWHFVSSVDIRWMLELTGPHVQRRNSAYNRQLGLDPRVMTCGAGVIERALGDSGCLSRRELSTHLERAGLPARSTHLAHIMMHAELEGLICSGPRRGKQSTYALLAERAPKARRLPRDEALAELTRRYLRSHGPATLRDYVWWSGLGTADARRGLEIVAAKSREVDGLTYWSVGQDPGIVRPRGAEVHLLPVYDEYLVAYRDQQAVPRPAYIMGAFQHALVIDGQVAGAWRTGSGKHGVTVQVSPNRRLTPAERRGVAQAVARYRSFVN